MCALFGYLNYGKHVPWKNLQKLVQALANASEVRGHHAAGIAYNKADTLTIFKRPKPAHKLHFRIPEGTAAVMGHARLTTQGNQKHNFNNHPFRGFACTEFALAHNGILYNDMTLRKQLNLPDTQIETDSYIAVQLLESKGDLSFESLRYAAEQVRGYFTFTLLDRADNLYFVKGESPLYLIHFPTLGLYAYSSTKEIMMAAFKQIPAQFPKYEVIDVKKGELLRISPDGKITRSSYTVHDDYSIYSNRWYGLGSSFYNWEKVVPTDCFEDSDYLILIELAGYYGVDPEDIRYGEVKDFSPIIEQAKKCPPPTEIETGSIIGGFAHEQVFALADTVVEAVKSGAIRKFVVMAGCDGRAKSRSYYQEFAEKLPKDTVILTAGCAKYKYNKLDLGDIGGIR